MTNRKNQQFMWIRFASLALVVLLTACASNKPVLTDSALEGADGVDVVTPLPEGLEEAYTDGLSLMEDERFEEALAHWQGVSTQFPGYPGVWVNMGLTQWQLMQPEDALQSYEQSISLDEEYCPPYGLSGIVLRDLGRFEDAETAYLSAIDCDPQYAMNYYNLGILKDLYRNDLVAALSWYRKARRLMPDDEKLNIWVIDLARRSGEPEDDPEEIDVWQAELEALIRKREAEAAAARAAKLAAQANQTDGVEVVAENQAENQAEGQIEGESVAESQPEEPIEPDATEAGTDELNETVEQTEAAAETTNEGDASVEGEASDREGAE